VSTKITVFSINNPEVRNFLLKYTQTEPLNESTLRINYQPECYEETLNNIRVLCGKENIWVFIFETSGKKVANIVIGVLKNDQTLLEKSFFSVMQGNVCSETHKNSTYIFNDAVRTL
jgi:hypothetical protein